MTGTLSRRIQLTLPSVAAAGILLFLKSASWASRNRRMLMARVSCGCNFNWVR